MPNKTEALSELDTLKNNAESLKVKLTATFKTVCELLDEATAAGLGVDFSFAKVNNAWQINTKVYKEF